MKRILCPLGLAWLLVGLFGCPSDSPEGVDIAPTGEEQGPCFANNTCFEGLVCASDICVRPPEGEEDTRDTQDVVPDDPTPEPDIPTEQDAQPDPAPEDVVEDAPDEPEDTAFEDGGEDVLGDVVEDEPDAVEPGPQTPEVTITHPGDETRRVGTEVLFTGFAIDPQEGELGADRLEWRSDPGGFMFTGGRGFRVFDEPGEYTVTLSATDSDANVGTASVTFMIEGPQLPVASIFHPEEGDPPRPAGTPVFFRGEGEDPQDGRLPPESLEWRSEPGGFMFTGRQGERAFEAGTYTIELIVTDSDGNQSTDTLTLVIQ